MTMQLVTKQVSTESGTWLDAMRKSLAVLRRAIAKDADPAVKVEAVNPYRVRLVVEWQEWVR